MQGTSNQPPTGNKRSIFRNLFYAHLFLVATLVIFIFIRVYSDAKEHYFKHKNWFYAFLTRTALEGAFCFASYSLILVWPPIAFIWAFRVTPLLTLAASVLLLSDGSRAGFVLRSVLLLSDGSRAGFVLGSLAFVIAAILFGYTYSVEDTRFDEAFKVLRFSRRTDCTIFLFGFLSTLIGTVYAAFLVVGIGGATSIATRTTTSSMLVLVMLLSLVWSTSVITNIQIVTFGSVLYKKMVDAVETSPFHTLFHTTSKFLGQIFFRSIVPMIPGKADLVNPWDLVDPEFSSNERVSEEKWEKFTQAGIVEKINDDITGAFFWLSGVAVGGVCSICVGLNSMVNHDSYTTELMLWAFLIGYSLTRIAMAWPQACCTAYFVAYSDNRSSQIFRANVENA